MSDSLWSHELQHTRPPCPSPTLRVHTNSYPSSRWCHPAIFPSCPQSLPAWESFPMSQLFTKGDQSTGVSALASFLPKKSQGWSPSDGLVGSPCSPRNSQESFPTPQFKSIKPSALSFLYSPILTSIHDYRKKTVTLTRWTFVNKVLSLLFNVLSRLVVVFLPRSKCILISWL